MLECGKRSCAGSDEVSLTVRIFKSNSEFIFISHTNSFDIINVNVILLLHVFVLIIKDFLEYKEKKELI